MLTLCPECNNHYDDEWRSAECDGPGRSGSHKSTKRTSAITEHIANAKATAPAKTA